MADLTILTYNSTGLSETKRQYIYKLLCEVSPEILLLQETWLLNSSLGILGNIHKDYLFCGTSGVPEGGLLHGRPHGGTAILWKKDISQYLKVITTNTPFMVALLLFWQAAKIAIESL